MKIFLLSWKKVLAVVVGWFAAVILHNLVSALLGTEEAVFFIIAIFLIPAYAIMAVIYTAIKKLKNYS